MLQTRPAGHAWLSTLWARHGLGRPARRDDAQRQARIVEGRLAALQGHVAGRARAPAAGRPHDRGVAGLTAAAPLPAAPDAPRCGAGAFTVPLAWDTPPSPGPAPAAADAGSDLHSRREGSRDSSAAHLLTPARVASYQAAAARSAAAAGCPASRSLPGPGPARAAPAGRCLPGACAGGEQRQPRDTAGAVSAGEAAAGAAGGPAQRAGARRRLSLDALAHGRPTSGGLAAAALRRPRAGGTGAPQAEADTAVPYPDPGHSAGVGAAEGTAPPARSGPPAQAASNPGPAYQARPAQKAAPAPAASPGTAPGFGGFGLPRAQTVPALPGGRGTAGSEGGSGDGGAQEEEARGRRAAGSQGMEGAAAAAMPAACAGHAQQACQREPDAPVWHSNPTCVAWAGGRGVAAQVPATAPSHQGWAALWAVEAAEGSPDACSAGNGARAEPGGACDRALAASSSACALTGACWDAAPDAPAAGGARPLPARAEHTSASCGIQAAPRPSGSGARRPQPAQAPAPAGAPRLASPSAEAASAGACAAARGAPLPGPLPMPAGLAAERTGARAGARRPGRAGGAPPGARQGPRGLAAPWSARKEHGASPQPSRVSGGPARAPLEVRFSLPAEGPQPSAGSVGRAPGAALPDAPLPSSPAGAPPAAPGREARGRSPAPEQAQLAALRGRLALGQLAAAAADAELAGAQRMRDHLAGRLAALTALRHRWANCNPVHGRAPVTQQRPTMLP